MTVPGYLPWPWWPPFDVPVLAHTQPAPCLLQLRVAGGVPVTEVGCTYLCHTRHTGTPGCCRARACAPSACPSWQRTSRTAHRRGSSHLKNGRVEAQGLQTLNLWSGCKGSNGEGRWPSTAGARDHSHPVSPPPGHLPLGSWAMRGSRGPGGLMEQGGSVVRGSSG